MAKRKNYITNKELHYEIKKYQKSGVHSEKLHLMFYKMAEQISSKGNFANYTWQEDMISDAYLKCLEVSAKFDLKRENPFSYFTTVIHNYFYDVIESAKKLKAVKEKLRENYNTGVYIRYGIDFTQRKKNV